MATDGATDTGGPTWIRVLLIRRVCALTLVVALSIIGIPLPASAAGDEDPAPARRLTIQGQPLAHAVGTMPGISERLSPTQSLATGLLLRGGLKTFTPQVQGGPSNSQFRLPQGRNRRRNIWLGAAIGGGAGFVTGWVMDAERCRNEHGGPCGTPRAFAGLFGLIGAGIGSAVGSAFGR